MEKRILPVIILLASFAATRFLSVNIILMILICGIIGAADTFRRERARRKQA